MAEILKKHSRLLLLGFSFLFFLALFMQFSVKEAKAYTRKVVPVVFYAADSQYPDDRYLQKLNSSLAALQGWYQAKIGQSFQFAPARRFQGASFKGYYAYSDHFACGDFRLQCNIQSEMAVHEKATLKFFGVPDTGLGWSDAAVMLFTHDVVDQYNLAWGRTFQVYYHPPVTEITWTIMNDAVVDTLTDDPGTCSDNAPHMYPGATICGLVAHELGHMFSLQHTCGVLYDLMCSDGSGARAFPASNFVQDSINLMRFSPFLSPNYDTTSPHFFCFDSDNPQQWCSGPIIGQTLAGNLPHEIAQPEPILSNPDCCRSNYSPRVSLGGFNLEWCIAGAPRNSSYCQHQNSLVTTYSKTIGLKPLDDNGNHLYYDIYIDYQTISSGVVPWKVQKNVTQACFGVTCDYTVTWAKPLFSAKLYRADTNTSACSGYSGCTDYVASFPEDNPNPAFLSLPPDLGVDMVVQLKTMENSGSAVTHWKATGLVTPTCPLKKPTAPAAPTIGTSSLSGTPNTQNVTLNWSPPSNWGNECNLTNPREYLVAVGVTNPPAFYMKTTSTSITVPNLTPGATFYWSIAAENAANVRGTFSSLGTFVSADEVATNKFNGQYFGNVDFTNSKLIRNDSKIDFNWGAGSPDPSVGADKFSARWTGTFNFNAASYNFNVKADDKALVYVDNNIVLDASAGSGTYNKIVPITSGIHGIRVDYIETTGNASISVSWGLPDTDGDGCPDAKELGTDWHLGGQRDASNPWDFYDVPSPALSATATNGTRDQAVTISDTISILYYIGTAHNGPANANGVSYDTDINHNGVADGQEYDRTSSLDSNQPWRSGAPNGAVSMADAIVALAQVGTNCK